jgi:hypothetical protein
MWLSILLDPLVLIWILFCCINSHLGASSSDYIDVFPIILGFYRNPLDILVVLVPFFTGSFPRVLGNILCHGLLHDSTYMSLVEVDNPLHNFLVFGSCGTLQVLFLIQILLFLVLHLCIHPDILVVCCIGVPGYTARYYTVVARCCIVAMNCCNVATYCCMVVEPR